MRARLLGGDVAVFHERLHDAVVVRDACDLAAADQIRAAVADVADDLNCYSFVTL